MKRKFLKYLLYFICLFFVVLIFSNSQSKEFIKVSFLDVGQGDGTLINFSNQKIVLIDGGPDNLLLRSMGGELPFYKKKIDAIVISHFHNDHIAGLIEVFRRYKVDLLIYGRGLKQFYPNTVLIDEARKQGTKIIELDKSLSISLAPACNLELIHPKEFTIDNDNDSVIAKLSCRHFSFLASGDNEQEIEKAMVEKRANVSAQLFKASHHGSKTSNTSDFLSLIRPSLIVISASLDNSFGHPSPEVIKSILDLGIEYREISKEGTISILEVF